MMANTADIAIVVPVLGDAAPLRELLVRVRGWAPQPSEIRVVAGASSAQLAHTCGEFACELEVAEPCRGRQLDIGARNTTADTIWFLHADAAPAAKSLGAIAAARTAGAESGCFRFTFTGPSSFPKRVIASGVALRLRLGGIPYGDQGLWASRTAYLAAGGFAHEPLFEEVRLVKRLRKRSTFDLLDEPIGVSPRRWERDGWLRRSIANRWLALGYAVGISPARLAARYDRPRLSENRVR